MADTDDNPDDEEVGLEHLRPSPFGTDLRRQDLSGLDLTRVNFIRADLVEADFSGASLTEADFTDADLSSANMQGAVLNKAVLAFANLTEVELSEANLADADLVGATLLNSDLSGAIARQANLHGADLTNADLSGADLRDADLTAANLTETNLSEADLTGANLRGANLTGANLTEADLTKADLTKARLTGADLLKAALAEAILAEANLANTNLTEASLSRAKIQSAILTAAVLTDANLGEADLRKADLKEANLCRVDLRQASLVDARLDGADLTGAKLWETQRGGWSIKGVVCQRAFLTRTADEPSEYSNGEFERLFAELPRIRLRYPGGMTQVDLLMLPLVIERLQVEHEECTLSIRSMQNEGKGEAVVTITVEDRVGRTGFDFKQELLRLQTKLDCVEAERDRFTSCLMPQLLGLIEASRQTNIGQLAIGGKMSGDNYTSGQAGAVGPHAHAHEMTFQQIWSQGGIDLQKLGDELRVLRNAMKKESEGPPDQDEAVGAVAAAEKAAVTGDGPAALQHLKNAGRWALQIGEKVGVSIATKAIERAMLS